MTELTREQVEEWERIAEEGDESTLADLASRIVPILCRALLNMEVFEDRDRWKAKCERYEAALRKIASCESRVAGDVVDIARRALPPAPGGERE